VLVQDFLESSARQFPEKTALVCGDRRLSYRDIDRQCDRLAEALIREGVALGDRVVIQMQNSVEAVLSIFAVLKAGAVFVVLNPTTRRDKLVYLLNDCRATAFITDRPGLDGFEDRSAETPHLRARFGPERNARGGSHSLEGIAEDGIATGPPRRSRIDIDLAALIYTSGSTGKPKGVMLTHLNIVSAASSITTYLEASPRDVVLSVLPLSFDYGLYQVLMAFKVGATLVLERSFAYPRAILETLIRERVTGFPIVPMMAAALVQMDLSGYHFGSLRYLTSTAAALPTNHIQRLRSLFAPAKLYSMYGLTECKRVSYLPPEQLDVRPTSIGRGMPNEEVYIVDERGRRVPPGIVGELVVRGSNVMKGYWELPEETARVLQPGSFPWERVLYTGDLFRMDEEGYLYFVGRKDDIIKTRGEKVSPREVEEVLHSLSDIAEAAVVGVPDPLLGEAVKAIVTLREGSVLSEQDLRRHCARNLEDFAVPKFVEFRKTLPKTPSGKIAKRELGEPAIARM
jgi:amino acid adenylation domain-containing protein